MESLQSVCLGVRKLWKSAIRSAASFACLKYICAAAQSSANEKCRKKNFSRDICDGLHRSSTQLLLLSVMTNLWLCRSEKEPPAAGASYFPVSQIASPRATAAVQRRLGGRPQDLSKKIPPHLTTDFSHLTIYIQAPRSYLGDYVNSA